MPLDKSGMAQDESGGRLQGGGGANKDSFLRLSWFDRAARCWLRVGVMMTDDRPMTAEQAATLKRLAREAYELDAFKPNLTRTEAGIRIAMLTAKLKLLDGPPHTL